MLLLVLAGALAMQALLVGSHRHEPLGRQAAAGASPRSAGHDAQHCAICAMERVGGHYLSPAIVAPVLAVLAAWVAGTATGRTLPRQRAIMGWRSRAPPARSD